MRKVCMFFLLLVAGILFSGLGQEEAKAAESGAPTTEPIIISGNNDNVTIPEGETGIIEKKKGKPVTIDGTLTLGKDAVLDVPSGNPVTIDGTLILEEGAVLNVNSDVTINGDMNVEDEEETGNTEDGNNSEDETVNGKMGEGTQEEGQKSEVKVVSIANGAQINIISGTVRIGTDGTETGSNVTKIIENYGLMRLNLSSETSLLVSEEYELRPSVSIGETDADEKETDDADNESVIVNETMVPEEDIMGQSDDTGFLCAIYLGEDWQDFISCEYGVQPGNILKKEDFNLSDYDYMFCNVKEDIFEDWNVQNDYYKYEEFMYQPKRTEAEQQVIYKELPFYINVKVIPTNISEDAYPTKEREKILKIQEGSTLEDVKDQLVTGFTFVDNLNTPVGAAGGTYTFYVNYADNNAINYNPILITIEVTAKPSTPSTPSEDTTKPTPGDPTVETPKPSVPAPSSPVPETPSTASEGKCGDNVTYRYKDGVLTISGKGAMTDLSCQNTKTLEEDASAGRKISYGGMDAYAEKTKKIVIESGVTRIGRGAFAYFKNLESVQIKGSKKAKVSVGQYAFAGCGKLKKVSMKNVKEINFFAFGNCKSLKKLTLRKGVTSIGKSAFYGCKKLKNINLPSTVKEMGDYCFYGCKKLNTVKVNGNIKKAGKYMFYSVGKKAVIRCASKKANNCKFVKKANVEGVKIKRK